MPERTARRRRAIGLLIAVPVALALVFWGLTYTPLFAARHIRVEGNKVLSDAYVRSLAGVSTSTNVAHLDEGAAVTRLEADPWVAAASVRIDLPNTLIVRVDEREPVGVVSGIGERFVLASDGTTLPVSGVRVAALPVVRAALGEPTQDQRSAAAALLAALDAVILARVDEVVVGQDGMVTLTLSSGAVVNAGERGQEREKADALRAVLRWAATVNAEPILVDISTPGAPSVKLSDGSMGSI